MTNYNRIELSKAEVHTTLDLLRETVRPIKDFIEALGRQDFYCESNDIVVIGYLPNQAKYAYEITLFPPLEKSVLMECFRAHDLDCPPEYIDFLEVLNGSHMCELSLFGVPSGRLEALNRVDRSGRNPNDIFSANEFWKVEYKDAKVTDFMFASRNTGWSDQVGYFLKPDGSVISHFTLMSDSSLKGQRWDSLDTWFAQELLEVLSHRPIYLEEVRRESEKSDTLWNKIRGRVLTIWNGYFQ